MQAFARQLRLAATAAAEERAAAPPSRNRAQSQSRAPAHRHPAQQEATLTLQDFPPACHARLASTAWLRLPCRPCVFPDTFVRAAQSRRQHGRARCRPTPTHRAWPLQPTARLAAPAPTARRQASPRRRAAARRATPALAAPRPPRPPTAPPAPWPGPAPTHWQAPQWGRHAPPAPTSAHRAARRWPHVSPARLASPARSLAQSRRRVCATLALSAAVVTQWRWSCAPRAARARRARARRRRARRAATRMSAGSPRASRVPRVSTARLAQRRRRPARRAISARPTRRLRGHGRARCRRTRMRRVWPPPPSARLAALAPTARRQVSCRLPAHAAPAMPASTARHRQRQQTA